MYTHLTGIRVQRQDTLCHISRAVTTRSWRSRRSCKCQTASDFIPSHLDASKSRITCLHFLPTLNQLEKLWTGLRAKKSNSSRLQTTYKLSTMFARISVFLWEMQIYVTLSHYQISKHRILPLFRSKPPWSLCSVFAILLCQYIACVLGPHYDSRPQYSNGSIPRR